MLRASVLPLAGGFLPDRRTMLASAVLLCAIHSAAHGVELQEGGSGLFFFDQVAGLDRQGSHRRRRDFGDARAGTISATNCVAAVTV